MVVNPIQPTPHLAQEQAAAKGRVMSILDHNPDLADVIRNELLRLGMQEASLPVRLREADAAREALGWARVGDVLVLPVHSLDAKAEVAGLLDTLQSSGWQPGRTLPDAAVDPLV